MMSFHQVKGVGLFQNELLSLCKQRRICHFLLLHKLLRHTRECPFDSQNPLCKVMKTTALFVALKNKRMHGGPRPCWAFRFVGDSFGLEMHGEY